MPELPEVETVVRTLAPRLCGSVIARIATTASRVFRGRQKEIEAALAGKRILEVRRHGKNILIELGTRLLRIHLGMTGKLLFDPVNATHPRATLHLRNSQARVLVFDDPRHFGRFELIEDVSALALGPDPLEISPSEFTQALHARRGPVKSLLLNQAFLRGMGNIYTDESLFQARIHPLTPACAVPPEKAKALHEAMRRVLLEAIEQGGSSISDYVDAEGREGAFQSQHRVYGREGKPCSRCGEVIRRIVVGQRGTHYCERCQPAPRGIRSPVAGAK
ncbi:MAG: bifunctional DNA-formamidopyrimidine glycosylase/DNA-(apurinic or apyrimidinic site) lyase [Bryobacterales bacterium]|nr:bifunctional DNA-formamidopyrimidine glycosylase/DNA-(apurinic or apyrimidinic site) lyase [Bryobacterales bacterium]